MKKEKMRYLLPAIEEQIFEKSYRITKNLSVYVRK